MYLGHNLPVVSTKGGSIVNSALAELIVFSDDYTYENISNAIQRVNLKRIFNGREAVRELRTEFLNKLMEAL